ncbi:MAG: glycosyltransferase [Parvularculaceae bacterium]|nr:glycosyltransferase [Parvularculaceae bacterium]
MAFLTIGDCESSLDRPVDRRTFGALLRDRHAEELKYEATEAFAAQCPRESARNLLLSSSVRSALITAVLVIAALIALSPRLVMASAMLLVLAYFFGVAAVRLFLTVIACFQPKPQERRALDDADLPIITILAPLFREAHALPGLVQAISRLDYPADRLDVKLILEQHDRETIKEANRLNLDSRFDLIIVPPSHPQTKPKACIYGLACAHGDLIVIYDAEDEPSPDQLRTAAEIFSDADDCLACVQARLNYYNPDENWLTRLFTLEYCLWFDHFLPALERLGAPIPLGGTSNIFRTDILVDVGGWDPHNVTEDADLGLRLARRGYRTTVIDSTTLEEANCKTGNWMRQRSRWMKGFMQTWLVHCRNRTARDDWQLFIAVDLFVGGTAFAALLIPFLWAAVLVEWQFGVSLLDPFPQQLKSATAAALIAGNLSCMVLAAYAPIRRGLARLSPAALLTPVYWIMMSIAAWIALWQLLHRPSFWEKTDHGLSGEAKARRSAALDAFGLECDPAARQIAADEESAQQKRARPGTTAE